MIGKKYLHWIGPFVILTAVFIFAVPPPPDDSGPEQAPLNPQFLKYLETVKHTKQQTPPLASTLPDKRFLSGGNPAPMDVSHMRGVIDEQVNQTYPPYYDLRNENKVTPWVKQQQGYSCWFHAVYNSMESFLMPEEVRNFDAEVLDYYLNHGFTQPLGGDYRQATACLARWSGPTEDPAEPYNLWRTGAPGSVQKHVQQVVYLPEREGPLDNNTVKWFIMNDGALYAGMRYSSMYNNYGTDSYYYDGDEFTNHGMAIVGWDDHYPRERFKRTPPGDGAFIGRMAWGSGWGEGGYLYVSYYDTVLHPDAVYNNAEPADNYGTNYQYDPLGAVTAVGGRTAYWGANVFTAADNQPLEAVSFYTTDTRAVCDIYVYKHAGGPPTNGLKAAACTGVVHTYAGYYTVKLDEPVPLQTGERFSVVIRFENPAYKFPVAVEKPITDYSHKATANPGESFISSDGEAWRDLSDFHPGSNVCIKAFSQSPPAAPRAVISCEARRETAGMWLMSEDYGEVRFTIENLPGLSIREAVIYRKEGDGVYVRYRVVTSNQLENGGLTYIDKLLEPDASYTYHVTVYDTDGAIIGRSREITI